MNGQRDGHSYSSLTEEETVNTDVDVQKGILSFAVRCEFLSLMFYFNNCCQLHEYLRDVLNIKLLKC